MEVGSLKKTWKINLRQKGLVDGMRMKQIGRKKTNKLVGLHGLLEMIKQKHNSYSYTEKICFLVIVWRNR